MKEIKLGRAIASASEVKATSPTQTSNLDANIDEGIPVLARLTIFDYERKRVSVAASLNIRVTALDQMVQVERAKLAREAEAVAVQTEDSGGRWPKPVHGPEMFDEITRIIRRHSVLTDEAVISLGTWILFTHAFEVMPFSPIYAVTTVFMRCGKTTLLALMEKLVCVPMATANITPAALFRSVETFRPTLLIDEGDTFLRKSGDLNGIINSGHTKTTAYVIRVEDGVPRKFSTWCPKVVAAIGKLPETMADRSILIRMRRKRPSESIEPLRDADPRVFSTLKAKIVRWVHDNRQTIAACRPALPDLSSDRAKDNWLPLMMIAETIGPECAEMARQAAVSLAQAWDSPSSNAEEFLADVADAFATTQMTRMRTVTLIKYLCADEEKPWATFGRGRPITARHIAQILRDFGIKSKRLRNGDDVAWGFELAQFEDAFARYVTKNDQSDV